MLVGLKNKESQLLSRKLCLRFVAGLLTRSSRSAAFPKCHVPVAFWQILRAYSSGNCPGFPPDSLLSLVGTINRCKNTKFLLQFFKNSKNQSANFFQKFKGLIFAVFNN